MALLNEILYLFSRALSGYIFMLPVLIAYFLLLLLFRRKQKSLHIATCFVFGFYLFLVIAATGIGNTVAFSFPPEIILMPFRDILYAPRHFMLNVIAFVPFGFFLPLLYKRYRSIKIVAAIGFLFSLCIELVQMFGWGATEIDDLIANTLGVCFGYLSYCIIKKSLHKDFGAPFQTGNISDTIELILLSASTFLIMALVQPLIGNSVFAV